MHERIRMVRMQAFRGVAESLEIDLARTGRSLVVFGGNGTGKSTIADALELYFRGSIEFLSREGRRSGVRHAGALPDVATEVTVVTTGALGGMATQTEAAAPAVREAARQDQFLLRGRDLARFVESSKGEKWKALAEILGLHELDALRLDLQRCRNALKDECGESLSGLRDSQRALTDLNATASADGVLAAVAGHCANANIAEPTSFEELVGDAWVRAIPSPHPPPAVKYDSILSAIRSASEERLDLSAFKEWDESHRSHQASERARYELFRAGQILLEEASENRCPLCGQSADLDQLRALIASTLQGMAADRDDFETAQASLRRGEDQLRRADDRRQQIHRDVTDLGITVPSVPTRISPALHEATPAAGTILRDTVAAYDAALASWDDSVRQAVEAARPAPTNDRDEALIKIGNLQREARAWQSAARRHHRATIAHALAQRLYDAYRTEFREYFDNILVQISGRVAELYAKLHPEPGFGPVAVETWGDKGVELSVDFHGTKQKPPHGVLSESHLNSLGLVLFLGMAEVFNERLGFIVLDDVVNSFDVEHRVDLARLLTSEFNDHQLIVLTHDAQFFDHLTRLAPSWARQEFTSWSYEEGPRAKAPALARLLQAAHERLQEGDAPGAAQKARVALEDLLQEACEAWQAPLPFRRGLRNEHREAGEVLAGVRRYLKDTMKSYYRELTPLLDRLDADLQGTLNVASHAGGGSVAVSEVRLAANDIAELRGGWTCQSCNTRIWHVSGGSGGRCSCGKSAFPPAAPTAKASTPPDEGLTP